MPKVTFGMHHSRGNQKEKEILKEGAGFLVNGQEG